MRRGDTAELEVDVVVIGAGMAGLAAAVAIHDAEKRVCVLEARERLGGRVHTASVPSVGAPVELGAEFVHGEAESLTAIARDAELLMVELTPSHWRRSGGALGCDPRFEPMIGDALKKAGKRVRRGGDTSFLEALDAARVRDPARALALSYIEGFQAADPARISTKALGAGDLGSDRIRRVVAGYSRIAEALAARLPRDAVRTSMRVTRAEWSRGAVRVATNATSGRDGVRVRARAAIVTLPLAILQGGEAEGVVFDPPLRAKKKALTLLAAGDVVRVGMRFRRAFWPPKMTFLHAVGEPFATFWSAHPLDAPTITAWTGGPRAAELAAHGERALAAHATASLARALGVDVRVVDRELVAIAHHDWRADPYARGAYSYPLVGGADAPRSLRTPLSRTLFFAGEHTADAPDNGTVHGALASGERAAREVVRALSR